MRSMHPSTLVCTAAALGLALASLGCGKEAQTAVPGQPPPPPEVGVYTVEPQPVALTTELPGRTSAYLGAEVRPQGGGILLKRLFTAGADVKAGDLLYELDPSSYQAAYATAKAALARAKAAAANAAAGQSRAQAAHPTAAAGDTRAQATQAHA
ncbi:MAG: hypothetical protein ACYDA8_10595, partial [Deferrisomatales bacterium]